MFTRLGLASVAMIAIHAAAGADEPVPITTDRAFADARQPQAAVSGDGRIYVAFGVKNAVYCCISSDGGKSYETPVKVGESGSLALGMRRGPRIAASKDSVVITAVCGKRGGGKDGEVLAWRSADRCATWQGPVHVNSVPGAAREGLHHLAASPSGLFYCVWNDLREPRKMPVYGAASTDGGATWIREQVVYASPEGSICPCCQPVAGFDPQGRLHVMWRNSLAGARDMYFTTSLDDGKTFARAQKLGQGEWQVDT